MERKKILNNLDKLKYTVIQGVTFNSHARAALIATLLNNLLFDNVVICVVFIFYCFATSTQLNGGPRPDYS
jgi:hypothetical protein